MKQILQASLILFLVFFIPHIIFGDAADEFFDAIAVNDLPSVINYLQAGGDPNVRDEYGTTPLMLAAKTGNYDAACLILHDFSSPGVVALKRYDQVKAYLKSIERGPKSDVNIRNNDGMTALMAAALSGNLQMVSLIVKAKADINATNNDGITALMGAAITGDPDIVKLLIEKRAGVNIKNRDGYTALILAAENDRSDFVRLEVKTIKEAKIKQDLEKVALIHAAHNRHSDVIKILIEAKADINARDKKNETVLMKAARDGHADIVKLLVDNGANVNAKDDGGGTAFMAQPKADNPKQCGSSLKLKPM